MFAVIEIGNQQFKVEENQVFTSQKTGNEVGQEFETKALLVSDENKVSIGAPTVEGASVKLQVVEDFKNRKIRGFKYKKRKNYHRTWGHRQELQKLKVVNITHS